MARTFPSIFVACFAMVPTVAWSQSGAFDMGGLTGTLSQDAVTQSEEQRADGQSERERSRARAKANCAKRTQLRAHFGADDPRIAMIDDMCRKLGY